jgi:uncharacterized membrane protein YqaE (UPF0057 family)
MKSLYLKFIAPLFLLIFVFGVVQYADAAFPGKEQSKVVVSKSEANSSVTAQKTESSKPVDDEIILLIVLCFILPPLAVYLKYNEAGKPFWVNVILTLLCGLPGIIHALYHVLK